MAQTSETGQMKRQLSRADGAMIGAIGAMDLDFENRNRKLR